MLESNIHFDYKSDQRRTWAYFIIPKILCISLHVVLIAFYMDRSCSFLDLFLSEIFSGAAHSFVWTTILASFVDFSRNLRHRFIAVNTLLRFVGSTFMIRCNAHKMRQFSHRRWWRRSGRWSPRDFFLSKN